MLSSVIIFNSDFIKQKFKYLLVILANISPGWILILLQMKRTKTKLIRCFSAKKLLGESGSPANNSKISIMAKAEK